MHAYKYFGLTSVDDDIARLTDTIAAPYLWASLVDSFNDPFEFKVAIDWPTDIEDTRKKYFTDKPGDTEEQFKEWFAGLTKNNKWYIAMSMRDALVRTMAVSCLTTDHTNHLLWSHYANQHKGYCIKFDISLARKSPDFSAWGHLAYTTEKEKCNFFTEDMATIYKKLCLSKSSSWSYENEYRIVFLSPGKKMLGPSAVKAVYIGCRADLKLRKYAENNQGKDGIQFYQMVESPFEYALVPRLISKGTGYMSSFF